MGYTHYWHQKATFTKVEWAELITGVKFLFAYAAEHGIKLLHKYDEPGTVPLADDGQIFFNGADEEGHETFAITRLRPPLKDYQRDPKQRGWDFCKTAHKPYDLIVTAILAYLDSIHPTKFPVSSDGRNGGWSSMTEIKGVELARLAWPAKANQIDIPREVRDTSRYDSYVDSSSRFQVAIDFNGQLWIEHMKSRRRIALPFGRDGYDTLTRSYGHAFRRWGSFRGDESATCATKRLNRMWSEHLRLGVQEPELFMPLAA